MVVVCICPLKRKGIDNKKARQKKCEQFLVLQFIRTVKTDKQNQTTTASLFSFSLSHKKKG
jgi:hypothetical protein